MISKIKSKLIKQFFKYSFAIIFEKTMLMMVFFYLANLFGPEKYGEISYVMSLMTLFSILATLGLDMYGLRGIAKNKNKVYIIVTNHIIFKFFLFLIVETLIFCYIIIFETNEHIQVLTIVYSIVIFLDIFNMEWIGKSIENYMPIMYSKIISSVLFLISVYIFIQDNSIGNIIFVLIFLFVYKLFSGIIYLLNFKKYIQLKYFNIKYIYKALTPSVTLMSSYFMMMIYYHIDKIMLGNFFDKSYVGMYDIAYKIFGIFVIFNTILWSVFSARIANRKNLKEYKNIMTISGILFSVILFLFSDFILEVFFEPSYLSALPTLKILSINIFIVFMNSIFISPLMLWNEEFTFFILTTIGAFSNIILNIVLIPLFDMTGAAIATLLSEIIILTVFLVIKKYRKKDI